MIGTKIRKVKAKVVLALHEYDVKQQTNFERMLTNASCVAQRLLDIGAEEIVFLPGVEGPDEAECITEKRFRVNAIYQKRPPAHFGDPTHRRQTRF